MALAAAVSRTGGGESLKSVLRRHLKQERDVPPRNAESWIRVSELSDLCPREEVLCGILERSRKSKHTTDTMLTFAHGHGLHWALQNKVGPGVDVIRGKWGCLYCGKTYGGGPTLADQVPRPESCECGGTDRYDNPEFIFREQFFGDEHYRVGGHPDGFLQMPRLPSLGILEGKSIGYKGAQDVKSSPNFGHVIQCQAYMWLTGAEWAILLYWEKGGYGLRALHEHFIERDEETISRIKELCTSIWSGLDTGVLPERICHAPDCNRAEDCPTSEPCFAHENLIELRTS